MRPLRLAFSLALPGCYQQAHGLATNAFPAAFSGGSGAEGVRIRAVSWNVAAVNNNPFEYWITHPSTEYRDLMESVEKFIVDPGEEDVPLHAVFTESMFQTLLAKMRAAGLEQVDAVEKLWPSYRSRRIVSEFLKDATIGKKRLASMPDRVTNTIELVSGDRAYRPTVINCFPDELGSMQAWFSKWIDFFFHTDVNVDGKGPKKVHSLLQKIRKAKYPAISEEEEAASVPLQLILQGAFDAILIRLMQQKGGSNWEVLRREICTSLNSKKSSLIKGILTGTYKDADVIFLQEAGSELLSLLRREYAASHHIIVPRSFSNERAQNSIMLLRQSMFASPEEVEVSPEGWEPGDLLLVRAKVLPASSVDVALASFHGDTNGLLTTPMLSKVVRELPCERFLFGLDANTHELKVEGKAHVLEFEEFYESLGLRACWGKVTSDLYTTFNARTYLQPQLNKAAKSTELQSKGDRNPKDFILFTKHFKVGAAVRDNTGEATYKDVVFPTLEFPSDHAAIAADLLLLIDGKLEL